MENASKALLIAGAILIAIVLVTIGIIVLGDTGETTDAAKDTASTVEIQTINAQFEQYKGTISVEQLKQVASLAKKYNKKYIYKSDSGTEGPALETWDWFFSASSGVSTASRKIMITSFDYDDTGEITVIHIDREKYGEN